MTISESIVLSLLTSALNIPFIRGLVFAMNTVGSAEYKTRFPAFAHEYTRRQTFETALRSTPTSELEGVINRLKAGKKPTNAIQATPVGSSSRTKDDHGQFDAQLELSGSEDSALAFLLYRIFRCCQRRAVYGGLPAALEIAQTPDPHWYPTTCYALPIKTVGATLVSLACFGWIGWTMNYVLLFTATQSGATMNSIASSFGISQATSIALTQPLTILLTLLGNWAVGRFRSMKKRVKHHIGYFADPSLKECSTTLSGAWAYWIFLYAGSASSLGPHDQIRSLGYSSTRVALAWLNGESLNGVDISRRDIAITTLYAYLRGLEIPPTRRSEECRAARERVSAAMEEYKQLKYAAEVGTVDNDVATIVAKIS